jgi:hypothetical protein
MRENPFEMHPTALTKTESGKLLIQVSHLFYLNELQVNKKNVFLLTK